METVTGLLSQMTAPPSSFAGPQRSIDGLVLLLSPLGLRSIAVGDFMRWKVAAVQVTFAGRQSGPAVTSERGQDYWYELPNAMLSKQCLRNRYSSNAAIEMTGSSLAPCHNRKRCSRELSI